MFSKCIKKRKTHINCMFYVDTREYTQLCIYKYMLYTIRADGCPLLEVAHILGKCSMPLKMGAVKPSKMVSTMYIKCLIDFVGFVSSRFRLMSQTLYLKHELPYGYVIYFMAIGLCDTIQKNMYREQI